MDELREKKEIPGLPISAFKQSGSHILCKILITPSDAEDLCKRTKSGLFKNKEFHDRFINAIVSRLDDIIEETRNEINEG